MEAARFLQFNKLATYLQSRGVNRGEAGRLPERLSDPDFIDVDPSTIVMDLSCEAADLELSRRIFSGRRRVDCLAYDPGWT